MNKSTACITPPAIPATGKSRWKSIKPFAPYSRETFRRLEKEGRAPKSERMGTRITFWDNAEVHRWLLDPANYRQEG